MRGGVWKETASMYLLVGDIVKVNKEQVFPADILFLSACGEGDECMVETSNLDGERNLKRFRSVWG
jgi:P-type E1-E2 ATPase